MTHHASDVRHTSDVRPASQNTPTSPRLLRAFVAMLLDAWREFLDAKILLLLLGLIGVLFAVALTGRIEPQPAGKNYLDLSARAMAADLEGVDLSRESVASMTGRLNGSVVWIAKAEPLGADLPTGQWNVELKRSFVPLVAGPLTAEEVQARFGRIADGQLWRVSKAEETSDALGRTVGMQSFQLTVEPGADLRLLWPHQFSLFGDSLDLTPPRGAPLGLEVLILQKLLTTGLGGSLLLLVSVVVTAAFVPNMIRKGTLELLLVRPLPRWVLLVMKYVGALVFVTVLLGLLVLAGWLITGILAGIWSPGILLALPSLILFFALLLAVSVCVGVLTRSAVAAMLVTVTYWAVLFIAGQMHNQVVESRLREENVGKLRPTSVVDSLRGAKPRREEPLKAGRVPFHRTAVGRVAEGIYTVLPHTEDLDNLVDRQLMRDLAVSGPFRALVERAEFSWSQAVGLSLVHTLAFLAVACAIFSSRDP